MSNKEQHTAYRLNAVRCFSSSDSRFYFTLQGEEATAYIKLNVNTPVRKRGERSLTLIKTSRIKNVIYLKFSSNCLQLTRRYRILMRMMHL